MRILQSFEHSSVIPLLEEIEAAAAAGLHAAGFITYEAAPAFDPAMTTHPRGALPLAWFGLFKSARRHHRLPGSSSLPIEPLHWQPTVDLTDYKQAIQSIRSAIEKGDTYQANFTLRLRTAYQDDPWSLFARLVTAQPVRYAAYADIGEHVICSASPELFFSLSGTDIAARPMKGTARRGLTSAKDRRMALDLYNSQKNRSENLMIVDMVRNDLGRIAKPGTVRVESLFDLETYESVHQLTSSVTAKTTHPIADIFGALFPCASITGAPKVRTMELLADLETSPRGIYTGALGFVSPDRQAQFNVAIRTVHIDRQRQVAEYGTGGGIVWDSQADDEYRECGAKALVLRLERPRFALLETLSWSPVEGFFLLERHLDRLLESADYFDYPFDRSATRQIVLLSIDEANEQPRRVRLLLHRNGQVRVESRPMEVSAETGWRIALSTSAIETNDLFLYHKTTAREVYDRARESAPGYDDVLLWNAAHQVTESTLGNLVFGIGGRLFTPPVDDGLLAGTFREELLSIGELEVRQLNCQDLPEVDDLWLINSVRRWIRVEKVDELGPKGFQTVWRNTAALRS
jgi:para-aminobenzoate synthetase/4-amino-4-deoxychorismate lyase